MSSRKKTRRRDPQQLLAKLFAQFQRQIDEFENRVVNEPDLERETKLLGALASTLERLTALDSDMKKKRDKTHAAKAADRGTILRKLCERLTKLAQAEENQSSRPKRAGSSAE